MTEEQTFSILPERFKFPLIYSESSICVCDHCLYMHLSAANVVHIWKFSILSWNQFVLRLIFLLIFCFIQSQSELWEETHWATQILYCPVHKFSEVLTDYQRSLLCFGETVSLEHFTSSTRTARLLSLETASVLPLPVAVYTERISLS